MAFASLFNIERRMSLPGTLNPSTMYVTKNTDSSLVDIYFTNNDATQIRHVINKADISTMIDAAVASLSNINVVANISERNALNLSANAFVLVLNATGDPTVAIGGALYIWDQINGIYSKVAEYESLDIALTWNSIQGKPTSTVTELDDAVTKKHTHSNITQLNKVGQDLSGFFTYNGSYAPAALANAEW